MKYILDTKQQHENIITIISNKIHESHLIEHVFITYKSKLK